MEQQTKKQYSFSYKLSYKEAYESFRLLTAPMKKRFQVPVSALLAVIAAAMLFGYFIDSRKIHYFFIAIIAIIMLFYAMYVPELKARKGAKNVAKADGTYRLILTSEGEIQMPKAERIALKSDKDARAIETDDLFVIRTDRTHTFCIPKRIINKKDIDGIREILKSNLRYVKR